MLDVDGSILRVETAYEVRGMISQATSYDNATIGSGSIVNQVQLAYNDFGQLVNDYQAHAGAVNVSTTPNVAYAFADGSANTVRPTSMTYPNGRVLHYDYGSSGGINDAAGRISSLIDNDNTTHLADYTFLGSQNVVLVDSTQPGIEYTLVGIDGGIDPDTGDIYRGLDRFGRIKDLIWLGPASSSSSSSESSSSESSSSESSSSESSSSDSSSSDSSSSGGGMAVFGVSPLLLPSSTNILERIKHRYDRVGNRLDRLVLADPNHLHDELYDYDAIDRLHDLNRGTLNVSRTALVAETFAQCWSLDETGNWANFREDDNGDGTWDLVQNRTANPANEITLISNGVGSSWAQPAYDAAGNMTTMPQPASPGSSFTAVYDAWNRLISLKSGSNFVQKNQYDGLSRRIVKLKYTSGSLTETRHVYYSSNWQDVEERVGTSTSAQRQFVWGMRYIDDLVLRDRDVAGSGILSERLYGLQDANWNVTAVVNTLAIVAERYCYTGYGVPIFLTAFFGSQSGSLLEWETLFGGYRWESETGFFNVRHRHYDALLGLWLQRDPITPPGIPNLYAYVDNNPTTALDPTGLQNDAVLRDLTIRLGRAGTNLAELQQLVRDATVLQYFALAAAAQSRISQVQSEARAQAQAAEAAAAAETARLATEALTRAQCAAINAAYQDVCKTSCAGVTDCVTLAEKVGLIALCVFMRHDYLRRRCDYFLAGSIRRGSANAERGHMEATRNAGVNLARCGLKWLTCCT